MPRPAWHAAQPKPSEPRRQCHPQGAVAVAAVCGDEGRRCVEAEEGRTCHPQVVLEAAAGGRGRGSRGRCAPSMGSTRLPGNRADPALCGCKAAPPRRGAPPRIPRCRSRFWCASPRHCNAPHVLLKVLHNQHLVLGRLQNEAAHTLAAPGAGRADGHAGAGLQWARPHGLPVPAALPAALPAAPLLPGRHSPTHQRG